ncbi:MAG: hypothetical protein ACOYZ6_16670 [Chloroflexota bacterium]
MDITCWNCKTVTKLDKAAVEAAIAAMDASKLGFHDIACASCGKANRTARDLFVAGLADFNAAPEMTKREINQAHKAEKAAKDKAKDERAAVKAAVKKAKK